ncbi:MAG: recombinase family protein [Clostridia bacterium]|nr:recombinase family protein [Clostridia bacterium]
MIIDKENQKNNSCDVISMFDKDSIEIQKIKEYIDITNLKYVSNNIQRVLGISVNTDDSCFKKNTNNIRVMLDGKQYRTILYIRLSVEDGDIIDGDVSKSIRNQLLFLLDECEKRNWCVVAIFCEEGISGADDNRPEWKKSLAFCEYGNTEIVLCKSQSRFSRSMEMIEKYLHKEFVSWNVRFVGLVDSTDTSVVGNKKSRQINGLVNEWQVEDQSINIRAILKNKQANGLFTGAFAPYGYKKNPNDKYQLIIDEEAAMVVKKIFSLYVEGNGSSLICEYLNQKGELIPSIYKYSKGTKYRNARVEPNKRIKYQVEKYDTITTIATKFHSTVDEIVKYNSLNSEKLHVGQVIIIPIIQLWRPSTVYEILKNEVYIGTLVQHKRERLSYKNKTMRTIDKSKRIIVPHCHSAIIDNQTWDIVRSRFEKNNRVKPINSGQIALFSRKIICDVCKKFFYRMNKKSKIGFTTYWNCATGYGVNKNLCDNTKVVREPDVYEFVLQEINKQIAKYYDKNLIEKNYHEQKVLNSIDEKIKSLKKRKSIIESNMLKKEDTFAILYDDRANGIITLDEFTMMKSKYLREVCDFKEKLKQLDNELINLNNEKSKEAATKNVLQKYKKLEILDRVILDEFISKIYIGNYNKETKIRNMKIEWNLFTE